MELTAVPGAPMPMEGDQEGFEQAVSISEALAGFLAMWGCRYNNFDEEVGRAQAALVTSLGGVVREPGAYTLAAGAAITVAALAHFIGWVTILEVPER